MSLTPFTQSKTTDVGCNVWIVVFSMERKNNSIWETKVFVTAFVTAAIFQWVLLTVSFPSGYWGRDENYGFRTITAIFLQPLQFFAAYYVAKLIDHFLPRE